MYSNTSSYEFSSGYLASASAQLNDTYAPWKAFDKSPASKWLAPVIGGNQYLQIDFPNKRTAARFGIKASETPGQTVKNGFIKGWDGASWRILSTITNQINWIPYEIRYFDVQAFYECSKFKLEITDINNMADNASASEFEIYELAHCFVITENKVYSFNTETNVYDEKQISYLGKVYTGNGLVLDVRSFALNGKYRSQEIDLNINSIYNFYHNIGLDYKNIRISAWIKDKINGFTLPWNVNSAIDYAFAPNNYGYAIDDCRFVIRTSPTLMQYRDMNGVDRTAGANVSIILEIERNFE